MNRKVLAALQRSAPKMNEEELLETQRWRFAKIFEVTEILAKGGHPEPGADPNRPN
jgi:hypothetical protein